MKVIDLMFVAFAPLAEMSTTGGTALTNLQLSIGILDFGELLAGFASALILPIPRIIFTAIVPTLFLSYYGFSEWWVTGVTGVLGVIGIYLRLRRSRL